MRDWAEVTEPSGKHTRTEPDLSAPVGRSFDALLGLEHVELTADRVVGRVVVRDELLGQDGAVHGGVYAAMSESVSSVGTYLGVRDDGMAAMGMSNATTVVGRVTGGWSRRRACRRTSASASGCGTWRSATVPASCAPCRPWRSPSGRRPERRVTIAQPEMRAAPRAML
jgi:hypothetical protein